MTRVRLSDIAFDAGTQIRASIDQQVVADYAEAMTNNAQFPPIVLFHDGNKHYLADGFHRFMAAQRNQFRDIDADVRAGTHQDALWFALGANKANGKRLSEADKKHAIGLAIKAWPDRPAGEIATQIGCSRSWVSETRATQDSASGIPSRVTGKDGKSYPAVKGPNQSNDGRDVREVAIAQLIRDGKTNPEICEAIGASRHDLIAKVRREIGVGTPDKSRAAVAQRRQDVKDMAERGFSTRQIAVALSIGEQSVGEIAKANGIRIHADRVMGKLQRHDASRIVQTIVMDAENLTADVDLIDFSSLPKDSLARWIDSLNASQKSLTAFIKRLKKEQNSVEAA